MIFRKIHSISCLTDTLMCVWIQNDTHFQVGIMNSIPVLVFFYILIQEDHSRRVQPHLTMRSLFAAVFWLSLGSSAVDCLRPSCYYDSINERATVTRSQVGSKPMSELDSITFPTYYPQSWKQLGNLFGSNLGAHTRVKIPLPRYSVTGSQDGRESQMFLNSISPRIIESRIVSIYFTFNIINYFL